MFNRQRREKKKNKAHDSPSALCLVTRTGRIHSKDRHSWNVQSRPGCLSVSSSHSESQRASTMAIVFTAGMEARNSIERHGLVSRWVLKANRMLIARLQPLQRERLTDYKYWTKLSSSVLLPQTAHFKTKSLKKRIRSCTSLAHIYRHRASCNSYKCHVGKLSVFCWTHLGSTFVSSEKTRIQHCIVCKHTAIFLLDLEENVKIEKAVHPSTFWNHHMLMTHSIMLMAVCLSLVPPLSTYVPFGLFFPDHDWCLVRPLTLEGPVAWFSI